MMLMYKFTGYINRAVNSTLLFLVPIFEKDGNFFQFKLDRTKNEIASFTQISLTKSHFIETELDKEVATGKESHFCFRLENEIFFESRTEIEARFPELTERIATMPSCQFDLFNALDLLRMADEVAVRLSSLYKVPKGSFRLQPLEIDDIDLLLYWIDKFSTLYNNYSSLLRLDEFFLSKSQEEPLAVILGRFIISKDLVEGHFDYLWGETKQSSHALLSQLFLWLDLAAEVRKQGMQAILGCIEISPVSLPQVQANQTLYRNLQSRKYLEQNAIYTSRSVDEHLAYSHQQKSSEDETHAIDSIREELCKSLMD